MSLDREMRFHSEGFHGMVAESYPGNALTNGIPVTPTGRAGRTSASGTATSCGLDRPCAGHWGCPGHRRDVVVAGDRALAAFFEHDSGDDEL
jgi:hypothetical protein